MPLLRKNVLAGPFVRVRCTSDACVLPSLRRRSTRTSSNFKRYHGDDAGGGRRSFLAQAIVAPVSIMVSPTLTNALDMDAFASSQLSADTPKKKELSDDEALCKFRAPGKQKGEACQRAGIKTGKSDKNKVDAFGNIDRGDFVRCNREWRVVDGKYQKFDICK